MGSHWIHADLGNSVVREQSIGRKDIDRFRAQLFPKASKRLSTHNLTPKYPTFVGLAGITLGTNWRFLGVDEPG
jgi:hypothetical protein